MFRGSCLVFNKQNKQLATGSIKYEENRNKSQAIPETADRRIHLLWVAEPSPRFPRSVVTQLYLPIWSPSLSSSVQQIGSRKKEEALGSHLHIRALFPLFLLRTKSPPTLLI